MADDVSGQDAFAAALSGAEPPVIETGAGDLGGQDAGHGGEPQPGSEGGGAGGEGQGQQPQPGVEGGQQPGERQAREEAMVPSWRLREIQEQREAERREAAKYQREAEQYRQWYQQHQAEQERQKQEAALKGEDFYLGDPGEFVDKRVEHGARRAIEPVQQAIQAFEQRDRQRNEYYSMQNAHREHGQEAVNSASHRLGAAIQAGDPEAAAFHQRLINPRDPLSMDPYRHLIAFDRRNQMLARTNGDLDAYEKRVREEEREAALKDHTFLQRALEAARAQATPVQTGVPGRGQPASQPRGGMPSLNRATGAAEDAGESDDPQAVFQAALAAGRR